MQKLSLFLFLIVFRLDAMGQHILETGSELYLYSSARDTEVIARKQLFYETAAKRLATKQDLDEPVVKGETTTLLTYFAGEDIVMVKRLLAAGATPSVAALYFAMLPFGSKSGIECAQEFLKRNPNLANASYDGSTFLYALCENDYSPSAVAFVKVLLSFKANPNLPGRPFEGIPLGIPILGTLSQDQFLGRAINQRKQLIHELIFHGSHLKISANNPSLLPTQLVSKEFSDRFELARYAERKYVFRMLELLKKSEENNLIKMLPEELRKYIVQMA